MIMFYVDCDLHRHLDLSRTSSRPHLTHQTSTTSNRPYLTQQTSVSSNRPILIHQTSISSNRPFLTHQTSDTSIKMITFKDHVNADVIELQRLGGRSE